MPVYEYQCADCGPFAKLLPITANTGTAECPDCGSMAMKVFPVVNLRSMRTENRKAWETNERSAHAPHVCGSGCSHSQKSRTGQSTGKTAWQGSKKRHSRPWMLGH